MSDEIIKTLHATKLQLAQEANFDIQHLIARVQQEERQSVMQGRVVLQPSAIKISNREFQQIRFAETA